RVLQCPPFNPLISTLLAASCSNACSDPFFKLCPELCPLKRSIALSTAVAGAGVTVLFAISFNGHADSGGNSLRTRLNSDHSAFATHFQALIACRSGYQQLSAHGGIQVCEKEQAGTTDVAQ